VKPRQQSQLELEPQNRSALNHLLDFGHSGRTGRRFRWNQTAAFRNGTTRNQ